MFKFVRISSYLIISLMLMVVTKAQASESICNTISECKNLKKQIDLQIAHLQIVRNDDGSIKRMTHDEATKHCASIGARLPSACELLKSSRALIGGYMPAYNVNIACPELARNDANDPIPKWGLRGDLAEVFWSSTLSNAYNSAFDFTAFNFNFGVSNRGDRYAVRCISDR